MSIKFILILQICSVLGGSCLPPISDPEIYSSWLKCGRIVVSKISYLLYPSILILISLGVEGLFKEHVFFPVSCRAYVLSVYWVFLHDA